jgi:putative ABC transport system permease protein
MRILKIAYQELLHKKGSTLIAILLVAIGMASISILGNAAQEMERRFNTNTKGIDMVVGAKGSPLQLVLSAVLHLDDPTGNIKIKDALKLVKNPAVKYAIPLAYGDNFQGFRVLGTNPEFIDFYGLNLVEGALPKGHFEALIGATVAQKTGLKVGDTFKTVHGSKEEGDLHEHPFKVVGILAPTGIAVDNLLITDIQSVWDLHHEEHEHAHIHHHHHNDHSHSHNHENNGEKKENQKDGEHAHNDHDCHHHHHHHHHDFEWRNALTPGNKNLEITALLVKFKGAMGLVTIPRQINENTPMQAALPGIELNRLYKLTGTGIAVFNTLALLVLITAALSILLALLGDIQKRYFEMALMRCFGATPLFLASLNILQAILLVLSGAVVGLIMAKTSSFWLDNLLAAQTTNGLLINHFTLLDLKLLALLLGLGFLAGLIPAIKAYRINIINTLKNV